MASLYLDNYVNNLATELAYKFLLAKEMLTATKHVRLFDQIGAETKELTTFRILNQT